MPKQKPVRRQNDELATRGGSEAKAKVEAFVRQQRPAHQKSINRLRAIVKGNFPELEERCGGCRSGISSRRRTSAGSIHPPTTSTSRSGRGLP